MKPTLFKFGSLAFFALLSVAASPLACAQTLLSGRVIDPQGKTVPRAAVKLILPDNSPVAETRTDDAGQFFFQNVTAGEYRIIASAPGFAAIGKRVEAQSSTLDLQFEKLQPRFDSVVITAQAIEPTVDLRNSEVSIEPCSHATIRSFTS